MKKFTAILLLLLAAYSCYAMPSHEANEALGNWVSRHIMVLLTLLAGTPLILVLLNFTRRLWVRIVLVLFIVWGLLLPAFALYSMTNSYLYVGSEGPFIVWLILSAVLDFTLVGLSLFALKRLSGNR